MNDADPLAVLAKVLPVIALIALGYGFRRTGFLQAKAVEGLKKLVVSLSLPALLFGAFAETRFEIGYLAIFVAVFAVCGFMLLAGIALGRLLRIRNRGFPAIFAGFETGMMGYSLFVAVFGAADMYKLAIVDLGQVCFVFFVLVSYLGSLGGKAGSTKNLVLSFVKSPVIIAIAGGILAGGVGLLPRLRAFPLSLALLDTLKLVAGLTVPLICLVIGYELRLDPRKLGLPLAAIALRLALLMAFAFAIDRILIVGILGLDRGFSIALYTMFLLPPPFVIPIFMPGAAGATGDADSAGTAEIRASATGATEDREFVVNAISLGVIVSLAAFVALNLAIRVGIPL